MSNAAWKELLAAEIDAAGTDKHEKLQDSKIAALLDLIWGLFAQEGATSARLQYLLAKQRVINLWLDQNWRDVTVDEIVKVSLSDKVKNLEKMLENVDGEIRQLRTDLVSATGYASGQLTATIGTGPGPNHPGGWPWGGK